MLDKIRIQNVRSLKDTGEIKLSPITLLVGENSSGKSTFLRMFPLLKQSICKRTNGPVLWAGDVDDYVDFGSFSETVTNDGSKDMTFSFAFYADVLQREGRRTRRVVFQPHLPGLDKVQDTDYILYSVTISQSGVREYVSKVQIQLNKSRFTFDLTTEPMEGKATVDKIHCKTGDGFARADFAFYISSLVRSKLFEYTLPSISLLFEEFVRVFEWDRELDSTDRYKYNYRYASLKVALNLIGRYLCAGRSWTQMKKEMKHAGMLDADEELAHVVCYLEKMKTRERNELLAAAKLLYFYEAFPQIEEYLDTYFRQVHYIAPLRATAERYYRLRNLAIDEVDYQGKNLAIFLNGLSKPRGRAFREWTQKYFGFVTDVSSHEGHISVKVALENGGPAVNMSDTGFGYSQILPIIVQLWDLSTRRRRPSSEKVPLVVAIEQPELHLHPALQARLANVFIASIQLAERNGYQLQLLIETHSETIVNYFGRMIATTRLSEDDVSVVLFEKDKKSGETSVKISNYDTSGYLKNWPIGFFAP